MIFQLVKVSINDFCPLIFIIPRQYPYQIVQIAVLMNASHLYDDLSPSSTRYDQPLLRMIFFDNIKHHTIIPGGNDPLVLFREIRILILPEEIK